jgi:hypothetical protein
VAFQVGVELKNVSTACLRSLMSRSMAT